ncbi:threonine aldolase family protein [Sphingobium sp. CR28]|uniref:threonine aldolase family protein n=1 Tax=Sphingobium sp. CR28 TaxID=3400272 RepID=UPI003FEE700E
MRFFSDNAAPVAPAIMAAIEQANAPDTAYDGDTLSGRLDAAFSTLFEREVVVLWVSTGTAANALALSLLCPPYGGVLCHEYAHILADECGAPEFYTHGARLMGCTGQGGKLDADTLASRLARVRPNIHQVQPHAVSLTNATESGLSYRPSEIAAIGKFCRERGLALHMDGARFANAVAFSGASPAELSWQGGVDILSFGFTKNGAMNAEALVLFNPALVEEARRRRKRAGHLLSKGRFIAAQLLAMLEGDRWLDHARAANRAAQRLAAGAEDRLLHPVEANEVFLRVSPEEAGRLRASGYEFYDWGEGAVRLVTSWHHGEADVAPLAHAIAAL